MTREEEQLDPEAEADFDQAFERMMAESLDSRKFERKAVFDVPLPIRRGQREAPSSGEEAVERDVQTTPDTMAFALMTKRGNRQQVCIPNPPSSTPPYFRMNCKQHTDIIH